MINNTTAIETEIKIINGLVDEAVSHGSDPGGSYECNPYGLEDALGAWISFRGISEEFIPHKGHIVSVTKIRPENIFSNSTYLYVALEDNYECRGYIDSLDHGLFPDRPGVCYKLLDSSSWNNDDYYNYDYGNGKAASEEAAG